MKVKETKQVINSIQDKEAAKKISKVFARLREENQQLAAKVEWMELHPLTVENNPAPATSTDAAEKRKLLDKIDKLQDRLGEVQAERDARLPKPGGPYVLIERGDFASNRAYLFAIENMAMLEALFALTQFATTPEDHRTRDRSHAAIRRRIESWLMGFLAVGALHYSDVDTHAPPPVLLGALRALSHMVDEREVHIVDDLMTKLAHRLNKQLEKITKDIDENGEGTDEE